MKYIRGYVNPPRAELCWKYKISHTICARFVCALFRCDYVTGTQCIHMAHIPISFRIAALAQHIDRVQLIERVHTNFYAPWVPMFYVSYFLLPVCNRSMKFHAKLITIGLWIRKGLPDSIIHNIKQIIFDWNSYTRVCPNNCAHILRVNVFFYGYQLVGLPITLQ